MSHAAALAAELAARLGAIRTANGYRSDVGIQVFRGRRRLPDGAVPCVVLFEGDDAMESSRGEQEARIRTTYVIEAHAACDPENPNDVAHDLLADMKRALFSSEAPRWPDGAGKRLWLELAYVGREIVPRSDGVARVLAALTITTVHHERLDAP